MLAGPWTDFYPQPRLNLSRFSCRELLLVQGWDEPGQIHHDVEAPGNVLHIAKLLILHQVNCLHAVHINTAHTKHL